jgi:hypothetical protein
VMEHPDYYKLREYLITFLEERAHKKTHSQSSPPPSAPPKSKSNGFFRMHNAPELALKS